MSGKHNESAEIDNPTDTLALAQLLVTPVSRRRLLQGVTLVPFLGIPFGCASVSQTDRPTIGFTTIPPSTPGEVRVPPRYAASVLYAWGDPTGDTRGQPAFMQDASNNAAEQALQAGMHHDGIHYFPLSAGSRNSTHGLLAINHELGKAMSSRMRAPALEEGRELNDPGCRWGFPLSSATASAGRRPRAVVSIVFGRILVIRPALAGPL